MDRRDRPRQDRGRRRRAVPQERLDGPLAPCDLARPPHLPRPQARLRRLPHRPALPGVRRGRDGPGEGEEAAQVREGRLPGPAPETPAGIPGRGRHTGAAAEGRRMTPRASRGPREGTQERSRGRRALDPAGRRGWR
ncbi:hypothetical protein NW895_24275 [Streptomyces sp. S.PNR 29]|nr:hypothetical protein [Streptomyces sp. S.PNR 29]